MATPNYSKSEWASLSIQERIRAMNKVTEGDDEASLQPSLAPSVESRHEQEQPKRSSVIDMWRKREVTTSSPSPSQQQQQQTTRRKKEKPPPGTLPVVSVPWPDEEGDKAPAAAPKQQSAAFQPKLPPKKQPAPSWRSQLKSSSSRSAAAAAAPGTEENNDADLTILPSNSTEEEVAAASAVSHSKSVMDLWTKRTLSIPDSPATVESEPEHHAREGVVETPPRRSSVVDIWTKRTSSSGDTPKRNFGPTTPKTTLSNLPQSVEKKKEPPVAAWNKQTVTPKTEDAAAKDDDVDLIVQAQDDCEPELPKSSSIANRYSPAGGVPQLRKVPPRPVVVETKVSEEPVETVKQSSVTNRWKPQGGAFPQLRKVPRMSPSTVATEPRVEDDEDNTESIAEETKPSSVVNRWHPHGSETTPQDDASPIVSALVENENAATPEAVEDLTKASVVSRWNPKGPESSAQPGKQARTAKLSAIAMHDDAGNENVGDEAKHSSVVNRWNPQAKVAKPAVRKTPGKLPPTIVNEHSPGHLVKASAAEEPRHASVAGRWNPQGRETKVQSGTTPSRLLQPTTGTEPRTEDSSDENEAAAEDTRHSSVTNRWNPQATSTNNSQLRKAPGKLPSATGTEPSMEDAEGDSATPAEKPNRLSVSNRWNPQRTAATPQGAYAKSQFRMTPTKLSSATGKEPEPSTEDGEGDKSAVGTAEESNRLSVSNRWNPQRAEVVTQGTDVKPPFRKTTTKLPSVTGTELSTQDAESENVTQGPTEAQERSGVSNRWNPQGTVESNPQHRLRKVSAEPKAPKAVNRWNPQGTLASPKLRKMIDRVATPVGGIPSIALNADDDKKEPATEETKRPVVVSRWKPAGTLANPQPIQPRKVPIKVPPPIVTDPPERDAENMDDSVTQEQDNSRTANDLHPPRNETTRTLSSSVTEPIRRPAEISALDRYMPEETGTTPLSPVFTQVVPDTEELHEQFELVEEGAISSNSRLEEVAKPVDTAEESAVVPRSSSSEVDNGNNQSFSHPDDTRTSQIVRSSVSSTVMAPEQDIQSTSDAIDDNSEAPDNSLSKQLLFNDGDVHQAESVPEPPGVARHTVNAPLPESAPKSSTSEVSEDKTPICPQVVVAAPDHEPTKAEVVSAVPDIEPAISLPFDESPATKLFASIDLKTSKSTDQETKTAADKVNGGIGGSTHVPRTSSSGEKEGASKVGESTSLGSHEIGKAKTELSAGTEDKHLSAQSETKEALPRQTEYVSHRSKALGLFASLRKHQQALRVLTGDESRTGAPLVESPVAKPAEPSNRASTLLKHQKTNAVNKKKFQSGTSAFTPKSDSSAEMSTVPKNPAETTVPPKNPGGVVNTSPGMQRNRSKRPKTMKEFLKQHRLKKSPATYSSLSSAGSVQSAEKGIDAKKADESVNSVNDEVDTPESSISGTTQRQREVLPPAHSSQDTKKDSIAESGREGQSSGEQPTGERDADYSLTRETPDSLKEDEPGHIVKRSPPKSQPADPPSILPSPSPRTRSLQERRKGRHKQVTPRSRSSPQSMPDKAQQSFSDDKASSVSASSHPILKPVKASRNAISESPKQHIASHHNDVVKSPVEPAATDPSLTPVRVQERARAFDQRAKAPSDQRATSSSQSKLASSWIKEKTVQPSFQGNMGTNHPMLGSAAGQKTTFPLSSQTKRTNQQLDKPTMKPSGTTPVVASDAGASDTRSFFSTASSGYSTSAFSGLSVEQRGAVASPASSLSNRASRALVRRRRNKLSKAEEKLAAQDLARRVIGNTIKEQQSKAEEEDDLSGNLHPVQATTESTMASPPQRAVRSRAFPQQVDQEEPDSFQDPMMSDMPRGPGLSGRYNTSSRFMDSVQNIVKRGGGGDGGSGAIAHHQNPAPNMSFGSDTTEGSSQIRSVSSTSGSEAWMSGRMNKSSASSLNRVPSDSTDGISYQSGSVMTGRSVGKEGEVVTEYFVSESSSNLDALKSAYEAVSLHQLALDLTDEVSVATKVNLRKFASDLNEGMSSASSSLRNGLSSLNGGSSTAGAAGGGGSSATGVTGNKNSSSISSSTSSPPKKLKVPTALRDSSRTVDEEVAIEVEYMEDSDLEEQDTSMLDSPLSKKADEEETAEQAYPPAGEPSQESSDRRRAYV